MRRTWWFRPLATLLTLWFPLIVGEPSLLQPCPTHGSMFVASAATPTAHGAHHAAHQAAHAPASSHHSTPGHHHICTCIGCCTGSAAVVPTFEGPTTTIVVATYDPAFGHATDESLSHNEPEFSRPYTTGPPRA
jgi:hypothetical protein